MAQPPAVAVPSCVLSIKAVPNAPRTAVAGWMGCTLKVRLHAPPADGKANAELCRYLAELLQLPRGAVEVASGAGARDKRVRISGLEAADVQARLEGLMPR